MYLIIWCKKFPWRRNGKYDADVLEAEVWVSVSEAELQNKGLHRINKKTATLKNINSWFYICRLFFKFKESTDVSV